MEDIEKKYHDLLDEVTGFSKIRKGLVDVKAQLDKEVSRYEIITRFNQESLQVTNFEELPTLALESIIEAFECEFAIFLVRKGDKFIPIDTFSIELDPDFCLDASLFKNGEGLFISEEVNQSTCWKSININTALAGSFRDGDSGVVGIVVAGITNEGSGYYDPLSKEHLASFSVFLQQTGAIWHIFKINEVLEEKVKLRTEEVVKQKEEITDSINYAYRIQDSILGDRGDIEAKLHDSFLFFVPKDIVSGDFYWFSEIKKLKIIIVADCTGHGVPGAFMTVLGNALLNEIINEHLVTYPGKILSILDKKIRAITQRRGTEVNDGMDIAVLVFDEEYETVRFSGAMNPLIYIQDKEIKKIRGSRYAIGGSDTIDKEFETHQIDYKKGDSYYIFSDGFQDQFCKDDRKKYKTKRFHNFLLEMSNTSAKNQKEKLKNEFYLWKGNTEQTDDVIVAGVNID